MNVSSSACTCQLQAAQQQQHLSWPAQLHPHQLKLGISLHVPVLCCRFVFVVEGKVQVKHDGKTIDLAADDYAYFPPGSNDT
jgi:hypothetical protein